MLVVLTALATTLVLGTFMAWRFRATRSILEPGIVFSANLLVLYPIRLIALWLFEDDARPSYFEVLEETALERAAMLALIGSIGFVAGYVAVLRGRSIAVLDSRHWHESTGDVRLVWVFLVLSLFGTAYLVLTGDYISYLMGQNRNPAFQHIAYLFSTFQWAGFIGAWILYLRAPKGNGVLFTLVIVNLVVVPYQFIQGSKTFLSLLVVSLLFAYVWVRRRFPLTLATAGLAFVTFFVFPFVEQFRAHVNAEYGEIPSFLQFRLKELGGLEARDVSDADNKWWSSALKVSGRYAGIDELHNLDRMVPTYLDYRYGKDFMAIIYNVVPRMLWAGKPEYSRGADYGAALGTVTSVTPFPYGEALWQFGAMGLMPMMVFWGAALAAVVRGVDWFFRRARNQLFVIAIFISQIYWIARGETSLAGVLSGLPQQAVLYGAAYWLVRWVSSGTKLVRAEVASSSGRRP